MSPATAERRSVPSRIAFSTLAFPDATLAAALSAGRRWGYSGVELRLIDGELIDPELPAARRAQVRQTLAAAETTAQQTAALEPIAKYVAANLPIIPTTTASQWFQYNSQNYVGWPTPDNPYETGQPTGTNNNSGSGTDEVVLLHLRPRA